jgi:hypothetical protein
MPLARLSGINISYQVEVQGEPLVMIMGFTAGLIGMVYLEFGIAGYFSSMVIRIMTSPCSILSITSIPSTSWPNTEWCPSRWC